jgi:hypothetical protein
MLKILPRLAVFALTGLAVSSVGNDVNALLQTSATSQAPRVESGLALTCEVFCSPTKLRTANARIRWTMSKPALDASRLSSLTGATQTLEATIYRDGFEKGLSVALPVAQTTPTQAIAPVPAQPAQARLRAFQFRLIEIEPPRTELTGAAGSQMGVVVENLEPGMNYTWRIAMDTATGRIVSAATTCEAPVCPADIRTPPTPPGAR